MSTTVELENGLLLNIASLGRGNGVRVRVQTYQDAVIVEAVALDTQTAALALVGQIHGLTKLIVDALMNAVVEDNEARLERLKGLSDDMDRHTRGLQPADD